MFSPLLSVSGRVPAEEEESEPVPPTDDGSGAVHHAATGSGLQPPESCRPVSQRTTQRLPCWSGSGYDGAYRESGMSHTTGSPLTETDVAPLRPAQNPSVQGNNT